MTIRPWWLMVAAAVGAAVVLWLYRPDTKALDAALAVSAAQTQRGDSLAAEVLRLTAFQPDTTPARHVADSLHTRRRPPVVTPCPVATGDTIPMVPLADYDRILEEADSTRSALLQREAEDSLTALKVAAAFTAYRDSSRAQVQGLEVALREARHAMRSHRFSLGITGGYGATSSGGKVYTGPSLTVGGHYRFF